MGAMTSRERILAAIRHEKPDHVPLYSWVLGFTAPAHLRWANSGRSVQHWYTGRVEHGHTLPEPWSVEDDFKRVEAWLSMGVDDVLEVSVPWSLAEQARYRDSVLPAGSQGRSCPVLVREYDTPDGSLRHAVRQTLEKIEPGWPVQPDHVPIIDDFNIPRAVQHLVGSPADVPKVRWLYREPNADQRTAFEKRVSQVGLFARDRGVAVQAWTAFGMDAAVWMCGAEGAVMLCMDHPDAFSELLDIIHETDKARTELALSASVDIVCQRGWYSSTDFWSPAIFRRHFKPRVAELASIAHAQKKLFGYVMTTGVMTLGPDLMEAGVDLLYYVDPVQDHLDLEAARKLFRKKMAVAGGVNSGVTLASGSRQEIRAAVRKALDVFGDSGGFILSPVDALFPDTPWASVETMIQAWREQQGLPTARV